MILEKLKEYGIEIPIQLSRFFQKHFQTGKMVNGREELYKELIEETKWLPDDSSYRHRWHILKTGLETYPECIECGGPIIWNPKKAEEVERILCGKSCAATKRQRENKDIYSEASKKGHKNKDQVAIGRKISENKASWSDEKWAEVKVKIRMTAIKNGFQIANEDLSDWKLYSKLVRTLTRNVDISHLENINNRGLCGVEGAYQLDHIISVFSGFKNNILPHIIADLSNLRMITWEENRAKGA